MTLPNSAPVREVTPEERKRSARTFWLILLLFPMLIGAILAFFAFQGREVRDYGQAVLENIMRSPSVRVGPAGEECKTILPNVPQAIESCRVDYDPAGQLVVQIKTQRGQQYRLTNPH